VLDECFFGRVIWGSSCCGSGFHLWVYHIYTTSCIYLLKNLNRTLFFKKIHFYFITDLFSLTEPNLRIRKNGPTYFNKRIHDFISSTKNRFEFVKWRALITKYSFHSHILENVWSIKFDIFYLNFELDINFCWSTQN